jgi:hypothetical protein
MKIKSVRDNFTKAEVNKLAKDVSIDTQEAEVLLSLFKNETEAAKYARYKKNKFLYVFLWQPKNEILWFLLNGTIGALILWLIIDNIYPTATMYASLFIILMGIWLYNALREFTARRRVYWNRKEK